MKFECVAETLLSLPVDMLVAGFFEEQLLDTFPFQDLDRALDGLLIRIVADEGFKAKEDQLLQCHTLGKLPFARLLLVGLGKREQFQLSDARKYAARAANLAVRKGCRYLGMLPPPLDGHIQERTLQFLVEGVHLGTYRFHKYKSDTASMQPKLETIRFQSQSPKFQAHPIDIARGNLVAEAIILARDWVNEPASVLTPDRLSTLASELAKDKGLDCHVLGPKDCEKQGMHLLMAVAKGSAEEPRFIHLIYKPKGKGDTRKRLVLVGKGVTFDAGGLSLKPTASMLDMKTDMAGAAAVLGVMRSIPDLGVTSEVHGIIPAAENMLSGHSYKIGDIYTGLGGKSVEIVNTDAEGRLILADALAYGAKLNPDEIIDIATLTGACVVALGPHTAGVMGNDQALVERYIAAARRVGEDVWPLPLPLRMKEQLKSTVADLKNSGDRWGGALTAGLFLKEFVGNTPWLHLDIAGPASVDKEWAHLAKGGTGFGVASLIEYLLGRNNLPS